MLLLLTFFLFSCNKKTDKWLIEHQKEIETAINLEDFFIPNQAILNKKKELLVKFENDLDDVAYTDWDNKEAEILLIDLQAKVKEVMNHISEYNSKASHYEIAQYLRNQYQGDTSNLTVFYKKINETLIQSDSFYLAAQANLKAVEAEEGQATVQQHFKDFHWLSDTLAVNVREAKISETLKSELLMNVQMTQLYIKDYIGFVNSFIYNTSDTTKVLEETPELKIEQ